MVRIYVALIRKGLKTMDDVPPQIWDKVWKLLNGLTEPDDSK